MRFVPSWTVNLKFMVRLQGSFYANELYDERGREIFDLETAIAECENQFGETGWETYNGAEGESRITD